VITVAIPGSDELQLEHLVLDYNGTLAVDGVLVDGLDERLRALAAELAICVLTADTFGQARAALQGLPCEVVVLAAGDQDRAKRDNLRRLGARRTVCIGNGGNDRLMLEEAALGIAVVLGEGAAAKTLLAADVVCTSILDALDLLTHPLRLVATLRC
jgi:soluble P-type ATPase